MRSLGIVAVFCVAGAPVAAAPVLYTFSVTSGNVLWNAAPGSPGGSTVGGLGGTFAVTVDDGTHIGAGDAFLLENGNLVNTSTLKLCLDGLSTATMTPGSLRFLDFAPSGPGQIPPGGGPTAGETDVYFEAMPYITGLTDTPFTTRTWAKSLLPFDLSFTTSVSGSQIVTAHLNLLQVRIEDIGILGDLAVSVEGTAHVVPDPALGGLTVLAMVGAGAWLRRRPR
jgi:hypothetical protein